MKIAVITDIHGNVAALEAVLDDLQRRGGADLVVNLGDCVSGPLWPRETFERLEKLGAPTVRGNHDRRVGEDRPDDMGASDRYAHDRLTDAQRASLGALPLRLEIAPSVLAFHARPDHDERYLMDAVVEHRLARAPRAVIEKRLEALGPGVKLVLCGHSHRPELLRLSGGRMVFNPGSVGCPAFEDTNAPAHVSEQGSPLARYGRVELSGDAEPRLEFFAVAYDCESAARQAEKAGQPGWAHALRTGFMPG